MPGNRVCSVGSVALCILGSTIQRALHGALRIPAEQAVLLATEQGDRGQDTDGAAGRQRRHQRTVRGEGRCGLYGRRCSRGASRAQGGDRLIVEIVTPVG